MLKISTFSSQNDFGYTAIPLFGSRASDRELEKTAGTTMLPAVAKYIASLRPVQGAQYVLVNALGAGEYYSSNINADHFPEAGLIHCPPNWTGNPVVDKARVGSWPYGFPTFYGAHAFAHHRNKDADRAYGDIELAAWHDTMKRVELVVRVDYDKCLRFGGTSIWDRLKSGQFLNVSMGCFVAGTLVTMADGTRKPIELIEVGERVLTHMGRPRRVLATQRRSYSGVLYNIKPEAHTSFTCTSEHPLYCTRVYNKDSTPRWADTQDVTYEPSWIPASDVSNEALIEPVLDGVLTPDYATREFCRLFGYYLAEGHSVRDKGGCVVGICLSTHKDDAVHGEITELCAQIGTKNPPSWFDSSSSVLGRGIYVFDRNVAKLFVELGGVGAKTKKLAEEVLHWHPDLQAEVIGAYANGDGCYAGDGALRLSSANRDLMFQWLTILPRLGVVASIQGLNHKAGSGFSVKNTFEWVIHIGKQYVGALVGRCAKVSVSSTRKCKNTRKFYGKHLVTPIRGVEKSVGDVEVFNLEVDEDNSYLVGNIAVHNSRVPFDTDSISLDWDKYNKAKGTFDPKKHRYPGEAILEYHKKDKIRGLSITRDDYSEYFLKNMNKILPDGRKVFVYNDYPKFFDISFVFIGADRTAKVMAYIAGNDPASEMPSVKVASDLGYTEDSLAKVARIKGASDKSAEIEKEVLPIPQAAKAIPLMTRGEPDMPESIIRAMSSVPLPTALSTASGLGMVVKPREFQRIILIRGGKRELADELDRTNTLFPSTEDSCPLVFGPEQFMPALARLLLPLFSMRTALAPTIERRVVIISGGSGCDPVASTSHSSDILRKIGSAYSRYREQLIDMAPHIQTLLDKVATKRDHDLLKLASSAPEDAFTQLSYMYLRYAYSDVGGT